MVEERMVLIRLQCDHNRLRWNSFHTSRNHVFRDFLLREKVNVETHLIKNCAHHIPIEASSIALNYILKNIENNFTNII